MTSSENVEVQTLHEWSFVRDFSKTKVSDYFLVMLRALRTAAESLGHGTLPTDLDLARMLEQILAEDPVFDEIVRQKLHIGRADHPTFARMFARYVVSQLWGQL
jgi:hypothetical protein